MSTALPPAGSAPAPEEPPTPRAAVWRHLWHAGRGTFLVALLALGLGFAISAQVASTRSQGLDGLSQQELIGVLDTVTQQGVRLGEELRELQRTQDRLESGAGTEAEALRVAKERADTLAILAGTVPASGPGMRMTIDDPQGKVGSTILLDALQELRDAGAEVVQIGAARVVAGTYFTDTDGGVLVSGVKASAPYEILVIGDAQTMASAMEIPGGVVETVRGVGGEVTIAPLEKLTIAATVPAATPRFAEPVASGSPTSRS